MGKRSLEQETEKHTYAEVRFRVVTDRVRKGAEQTFLWQSEQTFVQLASIVHAFEPIISVGGGKAYTVEKALHELEEYAYSLLEAFQALVWLLQQEENPEGRYQSAINKAANVYLFMMRGILVRVGDNNLRYVAAKASYEEQDRNFWAIVHDFFTPILGYQHRLDGNLNHDHANKLAALRDFINETYVDQRDGSVMQKIDEWLGH